MQPVLETCLEAERSFQNEPQQTVGPHRVFLDEHSAQSTFRLVHVKEIQCLWLVPDLRPFIQGNGMETDDNSRRLLQSGRNSQ